VYSGGESPPAQQAILEGIFPKLLVDAGTTHVQFD
jgi:hypothetical protein